MTNKLANHQDKRHSYENWPQNGDDNIQNGAIESQDASGGGWTASLRKNNQKKLKTPQEKTI